MTDKQDVSLMCHICGEREETVSHVTTECNSIGIISIRRYKNNIRTGGTIRLLTLFIGNSAKIMICSATKLGMIVLQRK